MAREFFPKRVTIHCSYTKNGESVPLSVIDSWHKKKRYRKIGYHYLIQPDGTVERGRALNEKGAHVRGDNDDNVGVCLIGNDKFTREQFISLRSLLETLRITYGIPYWALYCHNQFKSAQKKRKTCPNISINKLLYWWLCNDEMVMASHIYRGDRFGPSF